VNCEVSEFTLQAGSCNKTTGMATWTRTETVSAKNGGQACPALSEQRACAVNCEVSEFTLQPGSCNKTSGMATWTRIETVSAKNGGQACPALSEQRACAVDCEMSSWSNFACVNGLRQRTRTVLVNALNGGKACGPLIENPTPPDNNYDGDNAVDLCDPCPYDSTNCCNGGCESENNWGGGNQCSCQGQGSCWGNNGLEYCYSQGGPPGCTGTCPSGSCC